MFLKYLNIVLAITLLISLTGCGDNTIENSKKKHFINSGTPGNYDGVFVDSGVEGLTYTRIGRKPQLTVNGGLFTYQFGETISFSVGNIELGTAIALSTITVQDIVSFSNQELNTSIFAPEVNNRVRFLMTLDADNNPSNGITINSTMRDNAENWDSLNFNQSESNFTTSFSAISGIIESSIATKNDAETHFSETLRCVYSGAYSGSWIMPSGKKDGFVGVMIQKDGSIVALGDGQDRDNTGAPDVIYAKGRHDMDNGTYNFNDTLHFDPSTGGVVGGSLTDINGSGGSQGYNRVSGVFVQNGQNGAYSATRVGQGTKTAYRYTGYGFGLDSDSNISNNPMLGLFTFDVSTDGNITGMIHDARTNIEPVLTGTAEFVDGNVSIELYFGSEKHTIKGQISFDSNNSINLDWKDSSGTALGYISGIGCQLQPHN